MLVTGLFFLILGCENDQSWEEHAQKWDFDRARLILLLNDKEKIIEINNRNSLAKIKHWLLTSTTPKYKLSTKVNTPNLLVIYEGEEIIQIKIGSIESEVIPIIYKTHYRFGDEFPDVLELQNQL